MDTAKFEFKAPTKAPLTLAELRYWVRLAADHGADDSAQITATTTFSGKLVSVSVDVLRTTENNRRAVAEGEYS